MPKKKQQIYQSFLVRCWFMPRETKDEPPNWRFELQEVLVDSQNHGFSDLEQLKESMWARLVAIAASNNCDM